MSVPQLLLETLQGLDDEELKTFQWHCMYKNLDGCEPIRRAHIHNASRIITASKLTEAYSEELAVRLTVEILKKIPMNNLAEELKNKYAAAASSSSSSAQSPPAAASGGPSIVAQPGAVVIMSTPTNSTTGAWNINVHKP